MTLHAAALAQDREPPQRSEDRGTAELKEAARQLERLHVMAREAEERGDREEARQLHEKAADLGLRIRNAREKLYLERIEAEKRKIQALIEKAEELDRLGRHEEADEVRREAEVMEDKLRAVGRKVQERGEKKRIAEAVHRVEELHELAREAEERGDREEAKRLLDEAHGLEERLHEHHERKTREKIEAGKEKIHMLLKMAEELDQGGRHAEADEVRHKAAALEIELGDFVRQVEERRIQEAERTIDELIELARAAMERGDREEAKHFEMKAAQLENEIRKARDERAIEAKVEAEKHRIEVLLERALRLEREGKHDESARLRQEAEEHAARVHQFVRAMDIKRLAEVKKRIEQLHALAHEAEEQGRDDDARALWNEARKLEVMFDNERMHREVIARTEEMSARKRELHAALEHAEREGDREKAAMLRDKIAELEMEMDRIAREMETQQMERKIALLIARAKEEDAAGRHEAAQELRRQVEKIEAELHEMLSHRERDREKQLEREIMELREEIRLLREEVRRLGSGRAGSGGPAVSAETVIRRVARAPEISALLERLDADLVVGEEFNRKSRVWVLDIRGGRKGRLRGRVTATEQGRIKRIDLEPDTGDERRDDPVPPVRRRERV